MCLLFRVAHACALMNVDAAVAGGSEPVEIVMEDRDVDALA